MAAKPYITRASSLLKPVQLELLFPKHQQDGQSSAWPPSTPPKPPSSKFKFGLNLKSNFVNYKAIEGSFMLYTLRPNTLHLFFLL